MKNDTDKSEAVLANIRECLKKVQRELHGFKIVLFGSRAAGCARPRSDFDIGVIGDHPLPLAAFYRIEDELEALPTLYSIDWVDLNRVSPDFRARALAESRVIYG